MAGLARTPLVIAVAAAAVFGVGYLVASRRSASEPTKSATSASSTPNAASGPAAAPLAARGTPTPAARPSLAHPAGGAGASDRGLAADLHDPDPRVRAAALREYASGDAPDPAVLVAAIQDQDPSVAILATSALSKQVAAGAARSDELIAATTDRALPEKVRVEAMNGIGVIASEAHARALLGLLASADVTDRRSAAILLRHQDATLVADALITALADADEVARANALDSLRALARGRDFGSDAGAWRAFFASRR